MTQPPYNFLVENSQEIERRASERAKRPFAEPIPAALAIAFGSFLIARLTLGLADTMISDHRAEGIGGLVALICGGLTYLFLRFQDRKHSGEVARVAAELWDMRKPKET